MKHYRIAAIPGDGVGNEVVPASIAVLDAVAALDGGFELEWESFPWGSEYYLETGAAMPADALSTLKKFDAIYFGACGAPKVPDHIVQWGMILPIRQRLNLYVNLRPFKLYPGVSGPLKDKGPDEIDFVCVRENSEGEYLDAGGRIHLGMAHEVAVQTSVFTRTGIDQVARYAFELARSRKKRLANISKSNVLQYGLALWDEVVAEVGRDYPDVEVERVLIDAACAYVVSQPERFDVMVASNLFGDIITDVAAAVQGSMGLGASANIDPTGANPGMFEPVHGSAPDIAGKGVANPLGTVWAGAMMLRQLDQPVASESVMTALADVLKRQETRTPDLGGGASTEEMAAAMIATLRRLALPAVVASG